MKVDEFPLTRAEWVELLRSEMASHKAVFLASVAILISAILSMATIGSTTGIWGISVAGTIIGLALFFFPVIYCFSRTERPRRDLIDKILHGDLETFDEIRSEYCTIRQQERKYTKYWE